MHIGELAARSRVTVRTIRYYVEEGLLPLPQVRGKFGEFDESYIQRIQLIQHLKQERLALPAIRQRLVEMGLMPPTPPTGSYGSGGAPASPGGAEGRAGPPEGLFRSRFAEEAGLTAEQVTHMERMGLLTSSEGLLPLTALPLARAVARLFSWGAQVDDVAEIARQIREEIAMHRRLLERQGGAAAISRALQWEEQAGAVALIRQALVQRGGHATAASPEPTAGAGAE